ncbi:MAG: type I-B CRISPR-associated protein Cas8b/Csh1, partial [Candidatus Methanomethylicaceae archaeon]
YPEGTPLCIYNLDKAGFMPNLDRSAENLLRAHAVCLECKKKLRLGLNFVERNLTATIGETSAAKMRVFLIPKIIGTKLSYEQLLDLSSKMKSAFNIVRAYEGLEDVERTVKDLMELEALYGETPAYFLNLLFGERISSHFSFQYLIQDVPVMRFVELSRHMVDVSNCVFTVFKDARKEWSIGFEEIFSIFPLQKTKKGVEWKPLIELLNSMLSGTPYPRENIISRAVLFARIHRYGTYSAYSLKPLKNNAEYVLCRGVLKYNLLLKLLIEIGVIPMDKETTSEPFRAPEGDIESFLSMMGYAEWQKALFLLGLLVGRIGAEQYNKGDKKKAILNKINFQGMPAERVKLLAVDVVDGMRNYRVLDSYSEAIYANMKMMMDRNLDKFQNPIDNVFYILSGYAYTTLQAMKRGGENKNGKGSSKQ